MTKTKYIRRTRVPGLITENAGKAMEIKFRTKGGKGRFENVHTYADDLQTPLGYMRLETDKGDKISVHPLNTVELTIGRQLYKIRT